VLGLDGILTNPNRMKYLLLSVLVVCMIGIMIPSVFGQSDLFNFDPYKLNDFKKFIPDYYNYIPEKSSEDSSGISLTATMIKSDEIGGQVNFHTSKVDPNVMWRMFTQFKDSYYDIRDHIPGLPPTTCIEGWEQTYRYQVVVCMKDNVMIAVTTNDGEHRSTMKQILNKMDGQLSLPGTGNSIDPLYIIIGAVAIGGTVAGVIAVAKRGSKTPKPAKQKLEKYEEKYLAKPKPAKQKPVEKKETSAFCENCGNTLNPKAKFCGSCGTPVS